MVYLRALRDIDTTMFWPIDSLVVGLSPVEWRDGHQQAPNISSMRLRSNLTAVTAQVPGWRKRIRQRSVLIPITGTVITDYVYLLSDTQWVLLHQGTHIEALCSTVLSKGFREIGIYK